MLALLNKLVASLAVLHLPKPPSANVIELHMQDSELQRTTLN
jgi:hypothetical protein